MTVVTGLDSAGRERVIEAVAGPAAGGRARAAPAWSRPTACCSTSRSRRSQLLGLDSDLDPVIRRTDLPGVTRRRRAGAPGCPTEQFLGDHARGRATPTSTRPAPRQRSARRDPRHPPRSRRAGPHASTPTPRPRLRQAATALADAGRREEAARAGAALDEAMGPAADRDELGRAPRPSWSASSSGSTQGLEELSGSTPARSRCCSTPSATRPPVEMVPSERATELADEFVRLQPQVDDARGRGSRPRAAAPPAPSPGSKPPGPSWPRPRRACRSPNLSPADVVELEAAHDAVLEAQEKAGGRVGRRGNQKRLEEAHGGRAGHPRPRRLPDVERLRDGRRACWPSTRCAEQRLERAQAEMDAAEAHWADVAEMIEADPEHRRAARPARGRLPRGVRPARRRRRAGRPRDRAALPPGAQARGLDRRAGRRARPTSSSWSA